MVRPGLNVVLRAVVIPHPLIDLSVRGTINSTNEKTTPCDVHSPRADPGASNNSTKKQVLSVSDDDTYVSKITLPSAILQFAVRIYIPHFSPRRRVRYTSVAIEDRIPRSMMGTQTATLKQSRWNTHGLHLDIFRTLLPRACWLR